ncbi:MAG TPA: two-component system response regulator [Spongiibacteraceae bacterium]|nr:two-component system response regulator [Spongiibacteraceae bacterium]HCS28925.1 two-component system response regulator [Spongiibacteraceae bacterium]|tara:strand:- start:4516 stop:4956 length:441 start_codon:yes stop_codon:yes gene_type:complete
MTPENVNILLLEDDDGDAKAIQRALRKAKVANPITRAIDGVEALEILEGSNGRDKLPGPHLLLVDINMPRMDGIEFLTALRSNNELKRSIAFVLTTSARDEDVIAAYDLNVAGYVLKDNAGGDFLKLIELLDCYWRLVKFPDVKDY